jgi:hypothetical protein
MSDPRAAVEYRVPAVDLRAGDLVNTTPGEDDWQQVVGVYRTAADSRTPEIRTLVEALGGRYVVVQLTDLLPVDHQISFNADGVALIFDEVAQDDGAVAEIASAEDGLRTDLYSKFELGSVRASKASA